MPAGVLAHTAAAIGEPFGGRAASARPSARPASPAGPRCAFRLACWLDEMKLPLAEGLAVAKRLGAEYVWFTELYGPGGAGRWLGELSDAEVDAMAASVAAAGLRLYQVTAAAGC